jgi:hypothetical protein
MTSERAAEVSVRCRDLWKWRKDLQQRLLDLFGHAAPLTYHSLPSVDAFLSADPWQALRDIYVEADLELYMASGGDPAAQEEYLDVRGAALTPKDLALETGKLDTVPREDLRIAYLWKVIRRRVRMEDPPGPEVVANLVMLGPIPLDLRGFVAQMLRGEVKRRRGKKKRQRDYEHTAAVVHRVFRWERVFEHPRYAREQQKKHRRKYGGRLVPPRRPYQRALERVSAETGIPAATLDKWCKPR